MLTTWLIILGLAITTIFIHLEGLWYVRRIPGLLREYPRLALMSVVMLSLCLHVIEIAVYGGVYLTADRFLDIGTFPADKGFDVIEYFYFSAETFTALGYGDVTPTGDLRLIAVAEPLNGLMLISWSGAYTFIAMQRLWTGRTARIRAKKQANAPKVERAGVIPELTPRSLSATEIKRLRRQAREAQRSAKVPADTEADE